MRIVNVGGSYQANLQKIRKPQYVIHLRCSPHVVRAYTLNDNSNLCTYFEALYFNHNAIAFEFITKPKDSKCSQECLRITKLC
jgi:hypothetical protein